jgi:hypothetical protein
LVNTIPGKNPGQLSYYLGSGHEFWNFTASFCRSMGSLFSIFLGDRFEISPSFYNVEGGLRFVGVGLEPGQVKLVDLPIYPSLRKEVKTSVASRFPEICRVMDDE